MNLSSELNQSCEEHRLFGHQELSDNAELGLRYFALVYYIALFSISLNSTCKWQSSIVHTYLSFFLQQLFLQLMDNGRLEYMHMCVISGGVFSFTFNLRNWLMFVFVCDRFCTVFIPFRYKRHRRKVILILCSIVLALSAINGGLKMIFGCFGVSRIIWICASPVDETCPNYAFCQTHTTLFTALGLIMGSVVPMVMYITLLIKAKRICNQIMSSGTRENIKQRK